MVKIPYDIIKFNNLVNSLLSLCSLVSYRVKHSKKNSTSTRAHTIQHYKVKYLSGVFSPQYVVNASVDVFQRALVCKMAAFVQLAVMVLIKTNQMSSKKITSQYEYSRRTNNMI